MPPRSNTNSSSALFLRHAGELEWQLQLFYKHDSIATSYVGNLEI